MNRWNDQESAGSAMFLLGALAGAMVGAGVALLMAPKTGAQVRRELNSGLSSVRDAATRRYRDLADKASQKMGYEETTAAGDRYNGSTRSSMGESFSANPGTSGYQS